MTQTIVPPWGQMDEDLMSDLTGVAAPPDWNSREDFVSWRSATIKEIGAILWPIYNNGGSTWHSPHIARLFEADFGILEKLHAYLGHRIKGMFGTTATHSDLFNEEDDQNIGFGSNYTRYDPTLEPMVASQFRNIIHAGYANKVGTTPLQFKIVLQRPRPWQMAFIQGRSNYHYRYAASANTSSLVSGHCLQGTMAVCNVYAELGHLMSAKSIDVLSQFAVDIGDRRVFAGVHYPSDNLSSWFTAARLLPHVFAPARASAVKEFMYGAIRQKSVVYAAIIEHLAKHEDSPYRPIVDAINNNYG